MLSILLGLVGFSVISVSIGLLTSFAWGLLAAGLFLVFLGEITDGASVGATLNAAWTKLHSSYHNQMVKENALHSPHPPIEVPADLEEAAKDAAKRVLAERKYRRESRDAIYDGS